MAVIVDSDRHHRRVAEKEANRKRDAEAPSTGRISRAELAGRNGFVSPVLDSDFRVVSVRGTVIERVR